MKDRAVMARRSSIVLKTSMQQERSRRKVWVCLRNFGGKRANRSSPHQSKGEAHVQPVSSLGRTCKYPIVGEISICSEMKANNRRDFPTSPDSEA
jgi:hypothetical protein